MCLITIIMCVVGHMAEARLGCGGQKASAAVADAVPAGGGMRSSHLKVPLAAATGTKSPTTTSRATTYSQRSRGTQLSGCACFRVNT